MARRKLGEILSRRGQISAETLTKAIEHQKSKHDPMNNRRLRRATIRHPVTSAPFEVARCAMQDPHQTAAHFSKQIGARP